MEKVVGIIGLGKMGSNVARRLTKKGWRVVGYNRTETVTDSLVAEGIEKASSLEELVSKLTAPRVVVNLLPTGTPTDDMLNTLLPLLSPNDIIVEMANSFYKDTIKRSEKAKSKSVRFIDVGISGGPPGALNGACLMVGGDTELFTYLTPLFKDMAKDNAVAYFPGIGAGHFVKMVHNGIEYGMMQAVAEGFTILKNSEYKPDLEEVTEIYNSGSVIESNIIRYLSEAYRNYGQDLEKLSGSVGFNNEGEWTVKVGEELGIPTPVISGSVEFRKQSQVNPSYTGKALTGIRNSFGGHSIEKGKMT